MISQKYDIWGIFLMMGLALHAATEYFTDLSSGVRHGLLLLIGAVTPMLVIASKSQRVSYL
jgi:hypothetical protein